MTTPVVDPTFQPACYVFGTSLPGLAHFGNTRWYPQQAIFGTRPFGWEIPGKNTENDVFAFIYGSQNPKTPHRKDGEWVTSPGAWPVTPQMSARAEGVWAKRVIFYTRSGQQMVRRYTPRDSSAKEHLMPWQLKFMEAAFIWSLFDDETKQRVNAETARLGLQYHGREWFTKLYIKDDPRWLEYV